MTPDNAIIRVSARFEGDTSDGFLATTWDKGTPAKAPVLLRMLERFREGPMDHFVLRDELKKYPQTVMYGGPTTYGSIPKIKEALQRWSAMYYKAYALEVVPIAPEIADHKWPHRDWRWWTVTETRPRPTYKLERLSLNEWGWKPQR